MFPRNESHFTTCSSLWCSYRQCSYRHLPCVLDFCELLTVCLTNGTWICFQKQGNKFDNLRKETIREEVRRTVHWCDGHLFSSVVRHSSSPPYQWQQPFPIVFLPPLYSLHFIVPLGDLELVAVSASSLFVRYKVCCWGFTKPHFGHDQAGTHTGPPHHVERQQTCSSHGHG